MRRNLSKLALAMLPLPYADASMLGGATVRPTMATVWSQQFVGDVSLHSGERDWPMAQAMGMGTLPHLHQLSHRGGTDSRRGDDEGRQAGGGDEAVELPPVRSHEVWPWLSMIAYNLGNLWRRRVPPNRRGRAGFGSDVPPR